MNYTLKQNIDEIYAILQKAKSCLKRNLFWKKRFETPNMPCIQKKRLFDSKIFFSTIAMHLNS